MKNKNDDNGETVFLVGIGLGLFAGCWLSVSLCQSYYRDMAITNNAAHYDSQTGKFTWNDEKGTK